MRMEASLISTSDYLPVMIAVGAVGLVVWLYLQSRPTVVKQLFRRQFMHTTIGEVHRLKAESVAGVMITDHLGGQKEDPDSVVIHRFGRIWLKPRNDEHMRTLQGRQLAYVTRQLDSSALNLRALFDSDIPLSGTLTRDDLKPHRNLASRKAMADAVLKRTPADSLVRSLSIMALISVLIGGIPWLALTAALILRA